MLTDFPAVITDAPVNGPGYLQRIDTGLYWGDAMTGEPGMEGLVSSYDSVWNILHAAMRDPGCAMDDVLAERERRAAAGLPDFEHGVADTVEQVTEKFPGLLTDPRRLAISMANVRKADQPAYDGWRWSKWNEYIGAHTPAVEYLADEPVIKDLVLFEIHEIIPAG
jgi:hypothetical protein